MFVVFRRAEGRRSGDTRRAGLVVAGGVGSAGDYHPIKGLLVSFPRRRGDLRFRMLRINKLPGTKGDTYRGGKVTIVVVVVAVTFMVATVIRLRGLFQQNPGGGVRTHRDNYGRLCLALPC